MLLALAVGAQLVGHGAAFAAATEGQPAAKPAPVEHKGRPRVRLDRLTFPDDIEGARSLARHLRFVLSRAARRADWGIGHNRRIEYRFSVKELRETVQGDVLQVHCEAVGELPGGRSARSRLSYGGDPKQRELMVKRVLEIVARGVIARLAELERGRLRTRR